MFPCTLCDKTFGKVGKLNRHMSVHTNDRPWHCTQCEKSFKRQEHLKRHILSHMPKEARQHICPVCEHRFTSNYHLKRHIKSHEQPPKACPHCDKVYVTEKLLEKHLVKHVSLKTYSCSSCHLIFEKWSSLQEHIRTLHLTCPTCARSFQRANGLREHLKIHEQNRTLYPCHMEQCTKLFYSTKSLAIHVQSVHANHRPFVCEYPNCQANFAFKHVLERHKKCHDGKVKKKHKEPVVLDTLTLLTGYEHPKVSMNRPIACTIKGCDYRFNRDYDLKRHVESFHDSTLMPDATLGR